MPSIGRLEKYIEPAHIDQVSVPVFYFEYRDFVKLRVNFLIDLFYFAQCYFYETKILN